MALLPAMVIAAALGWIIRYLAPHRETYGVAVTPAAAAAVTAVVWSGLLLVGMTGADFWLWLISIAVGVLAAIAIPVIVGSRRPERDRAMLAELMQSS